MVVFFSLCLLALPLWWLLGVEQFVWPALLCWLSVQVAWQRRWRIQTSVSLALFLVFFGAYLLSAFAVTSGLRWLSYVRSLGAFGAGFLVLFWALNAVRSWSAVKMLVRILAWTSFLASFVGLLGIVGVWRPEITAPVSSLLPQAVAETDYGQLIAVRTTGRTAFLPGGGSYFRPTSFFLYPTLFATALGMALPFTFLSFKTARGKIWKLVEAIGVFLVLLNLVFSASRTVWLASLLAGSYYFLFRSEYRAFYRGTLLFVAAALACAYLIAPATVWTSGESSIDSFLSLRPGALSARAQVYRSTLEGVRERPFFGWGTERDVEEQRYPVGSHSLYLALLYRHGFVGFAVFLVLMLSVWFETSPRASVEHNSHPQAEEIQDFLALGRAMQIVAAVSGVTTVLITDTTLVLVWWLPLGLLVVGRRLLDACACEEH